MINHLERRFLSIFLAVLLVVVALPLEVFAALIDTTVLDGKIKVYSASGTDTTLAGGSDNNGIITVTSKAKATCGGLSYNYTATTHTVYVENVTTNETLSLMFDYSASGLGTLTIDGVNKTATPSGDVKKTIAPGEKVTFVLTSPATGDGSTGDSASLELSGFELADPNARKVTVKAGTNGTVSVDGATISADKEVSTTYTTGVAVNAAPASGYDFVAWRDADGNVLSTIATDTIYPQTDMTVSALFVQKNSTAHWLAGGKVHTDLNAACTAAQAGNKLVVLLNSATLPKNDTGYTVPEDVTVLIPYDENNVANGADPITEQIPNGVSTRTAYLYRKLTMADGAKLIVDGAIEVGAKHYCAHGGKYFGGTPVTGYGQIEMGSNSSIVLNRGASLYAWGYITGSGSVTAKSGSEIYEKMQITDYRGGTLAGLTAGYGVFPFNQYYVQNVEVLETLEAGSALICHAGVYADGVHESTLNFMGASDSMFTFTHGTVTKRYDAATDKLILDLSGIVAMDSVIFNFAGKDYNTGDYALPLNHNIVININEGSKVTVSQSVMMQPGATVNVAKGTEMTINSAANMYIMDAENWGNFCFGATMRQVNFVASRNGAPVTRSLEDAKINMNGHLVLNGQVYTTQAGAQVVSEGKTATVSVMTDRKSSTEIYQSTAAGGFNPQAVKIPMVSVLLRNGDDTTVSTSSMKAGTKVHYCADCDMWVTTTATVSFVANNETTETMDAVKVHDGCTGKLPAITFTAPEGMKFKGWNTEAEPTEETPGVAYDDEAPFTTTAEDGTVTNTFTADTTLYAQWEKKVLKGDVDLDGEVRAADATMLARHLAKIEPITEEASLRNADTTGEGTVSAADATKLARYLAKIITDWDQE